MKKRRWLFIIALVAAAHGAAFWALSNYRPMPPREPYHEGQFEVRRVAERDVKTGQQTIYREYTVSTKLNDPAPPKENQP